MPASLVFEGKYAGKSTQQCVLHSPKTSTTHLSVPNACCALCTCRLQLLNSTVSQLAKAVNQVLTAVYDALYSGDGGEEPQRLALRTAPLAAAEEVERLYTAGVLDCKFAVPATLHALGVAPDEIDKAVEEACAKREKDEKALDDDRRKADEERSINQQERKVSMEKTKADIEVTRKEARGMVQATA